MSDPRNWLGGGQPTYASWQEQEVSIWCKHLSDILLTNVILGCGLRVLISLVVGGSIAKAMICLACGFLVFSSVCLLQLKNVSLMLKITLATVFLHACQAYFVLMAVVMYPEQLAICVVGSSFLCICYELHPACHSVTAAYLILRQFLMWHAAQLYISGTPFTWSLPYIILIGTFLHTIFIVRKNRLRTIDRYRLSSSIEEKDQKLKSILQALPQGLAVLSAHGSLSCYSPRLAQLLSRPEMTDSDLEQSLAAFHCFEDIRSEAAKPQSLMADIQSFIAENPQECQTFGVTKLGEVYLEWKGSACLWDEKPACIVTVTDISSWVALRKLAQQESDAKTTLLRFVSHELRTPTNAVLNLVEDVRNAPNLTPAQQTDLAMVLASTQFLLGVINDLLDFSRIVADKFVLVKSTFDLRKEVRAAAQLVELQCARKGIAINTKFDPLIPEYVYSDPNRLKQVMLNLISNALKFTFEGGIEIVCTMTDSHSLRISVLDSGIGIPKDKLGDLFHCFSTIQSSQRLNPQGCGLGLVIANLIVKSLGPGCIQVSSTAGAGSCFQFEIDVYQNCPSFTLGEYDETTDIPTERDSICSASTTPTATSRILSPASFPRILVVDDSEFNRAVLARLLKAMSFECDEAETGLRAVNAIRTKASLGHFYDLILMDVEMPEMDGIAAAAEVRHLEVMGVVRVRPRIVACSAYSSKEDEDRCLANGMDGYLEKPVNRGKLWEFVSWL